jgi:thiol-disulfide isomerase/thioredoxin
VRLFREPTLGDPSSCVRSKRCCNFRHLLVPALARCACHVSSIAFLMLALALAHSAQPAPKPHAPAVGALAPAFTVTTLQGSRVSLADYRGKTVLVNFWATWCGNCKLEMPWLAQLREKYRSQGFEVLGIVTDDAPEAKIAAIVQKAGVRYPILHCNHKAAQAYGGLPDLPESFFIDKHGRIVAETDGADSAQEIEANIQKALEAHP